MEAYLIPPEELEAMVPMFTVHANLILGKKDAAVFLAGVAAVVDRIRENAVKGDVGVEEG